MHDAIDNGTLQRSPIALVQFATPETVREDAIPEVDAHSIRSTICQETGTDG